MHTYGFEAIDEMPDGLKAALVIFAGGAGSAADDMADALEVSGEASLGMIASTFIEVLRARGVEADELRSLTETAIAHGEEPAMVAIWQGKDDETDDGPETFGQEPGDAEEPANV